MHKNICNLLIQRVATQSIVKQKVLTVLLQGGLGNQMFQYCAAKSLARQYDFKLIIGSYKNSRSTQPLYRSFILDDAIASIDKLSVSNRIGLKIASLKENISPNLLKHLGVINQEGLDPDARLDLQKKANYITASFFQSNIYFRALESDEILKLFRFRIASNDLIGNLKNTIKSCNALAVHIRRGDYLDKKNKLVHPLMPLSFYYRSLELISHLSAVDQILIFTDSPNHNDIKLVVHSIGANKCTIVSNYQLKDHEEMYLMSLCKNHIIANSTFSWWGAYLAGLQQKSTTIAPLNWYTTKRLQKTDHTKIYPKSWIVLPSS